MTLDYQASPARPSKTAVYVGWVLCALPALFMFSAIPTLLFNRQIVDDGMQKHGFEQHMVVPIITVEMICLVIYFIPKTAVLGALLLTAYLGGAVVTHVRVNEMAQMAMPIIFGVLFWVSLLLREPRLRGLLPLRSATATRDL